MSHAYYTRTFWLTLLVMSLLFTSNTSSCFLMSKVPFTTKCRPENSLCKDRYLSILFPFCPSIRQLSACFFSNTILYLIFIATHEKELVRESQTSQKHPATSHLKTYLDKRRFPQSERHVELSDLLAFRNRAVKRFKLCVAVLLQRKLNT